jgi:hypothetical protein
MMNLSAKFSASVTSLKIYEAAIDMILLYFQASTQLATSDGPHSAIDWMKNQCLSNSTFAATVDKFEIELLQ